MNALRYDRAREQRPEFADATGIYVRAQRTDGRWDSADIAELDADSPADLAALTRRGQPLGRAGRTHPPRTPPRLAELRQDGA